jgi:hypothetical protein
MSIKIYEGYRIPLDRLPEATKLIHDAQIDALLDQWRRLVDSGASIGSVTELSRDRINRSPHDWEIGFGIFINPSKGKAYIIPFGRSANGRVPDWIEDFHCQNQTDEDFYPEGYWERWPEWEAAGYGNTDIMLCHQTVSTVEDVWEAERLYRERNNLLDEVLQDT